MESGFDACSLACAVADPNISLLGGTPVTDENDELCPGAMAPDPLVARTRDPLHVGEHHQAAMRRQPLRRETLISERGRDLPQGVMPPLRCLATRSTASRSR